jgi:hypothetical protein
MVLWTWGAVADEEALDLQHADAKVGTLGYRVPTVSYPYATPDARDTSRRDADRDRQAVDSTQYERPPLLGLGLLGPCSPLICQPTAAEVVLSLARRGVFRISSAGRAAAAGGKRKATTTIHTTATRQQFAVHREVNRDCPSST